MTTLVVPSLDEAPWPTLGYELCDFIESRYTFGPGDLKGQPYRIEPEFRAQIHRAYEVYPKDHRLAGRRRFKRVGLSLRKGTAKTEKAMILAAAEADPDAPVRCDGFDADGDPVGRAVKDPYIPLMSYTVEQTEDLGFNVLRTILEESALDDVFDIGLERILVRDGRGREAGKIVALAGSPNARDGARTTFQHFDETHRLYLRKLVNAHSTMLENANKRKMADPWSLETTTMFEPGQNSVAEDTHAYAEAIDRGEVNDPSLFYFHRQAPIDAPMESTDEVRGALLEASGPAAEWSGDIDALVNRWFEPKVDRQYYRRVWLNQPVTGKGKAFDVDRWHKELYLADFQPVAKELVVAGFDGAKFFDSTALIATDVVSAVQFPVGPIGIWERPRNEPDWEVPVAQVNDAVEWLFDTFDVWRIYCDPPYWEDTINGWAGKYGEKRVIEYWTNRRRVMAMALLAYSNAQRAGEVRHNGDERFARHIGNAVKDPLPWVDESTGEPLFLIKKERPDSELKIDAAMAGSLSWAARGDAIAAGAKKKQTFAPRRIR